MHADHMFLLLSSFTELHQSYEPAIVQGTWGASQWTLTSADSLSHLPWTGDRWALTKVHGRAPGNEDAIVVHQALNASIDFCEVWTGRKRVRNKRLEAELVLFGLYTVSMGRQEPPPWAEALSTVDCRLEDPETPETLKKQHATLLLQNRQQAKLKEARPASDEALSTVH